MLVRTFYSKTLVCQRIAIPLGPVKKNSRGPVRSGPLSTSFLIQELVLGFSKWLSLISLTSLLNPPNPWLTYFSLNFNGPFGIWFEESTPCIVISTDSLKKLANFASPKHETPNPNWQLQYIHQASKLLCSKTVTTALDRGSSHYQLPHTNWGNDRKTNRKYNKV